MTSASRRDSTSRSDSSTVWSRTITGYPVRVGRGTLDSVGAIAGAAEIAHRYAIITDHTVEGLYADRVARSFPAGRTTTLAIEPGEAQKTRDTWARLTDDLLAHGFGRDSAIIALGGGVIGDLAGFVAATFMRGIPFVQVPTTLLAMIDASIGAKTGVDTRAGKNLVGAFHRPAAVVADLDVLGTLPDRHFRAGLAEAIKHGVIADAGYFARVADSLRRGATAADSPFLHDVVTRSIEIKGEIVERDEHENGLRKVLNFGHTIGHAVEALSQYALLHGEAIAIGMAVEARLAERTGLAPPGALAELGEVIERAGLPTSPPSEFEPSQIVELARSDKKVRAGTLEFALPTAIGRMGGTERGWATPLSDELVLSVLRER